MKKLLAIFAVAAFLTACNGGSSSTETTTDSTTVAPVDTMTTPAAMDTMHTMSDSTKMSSDSAK